uniref:NADH-ubiquinone oxidoreductase chain 6 n=1 Tax=Niponiella limbatella TaxID=2684672 RepID=A0A6B9PP44_9NEOP|nr:NADH dehydrogenase subunit 6 [Niponiella limbatella]
MLNLILMALSSTLALIFTQMKHPLALGLVLLIQTLLISLITGVTTQSYWFSYILFLVFLGGMLVLFIYVTSLASNEMFSISTTLLIIMAPPAFASIITLVIIDPTPWINNIETSDMNLIINLGTFNEEASFSLIKLYNNPTSLITLMLALYLFLTLVAVIQVTSIFHGPLRSNN